MGLTKSCALDYAKHGITVNAICLALIDTGMLADLPQEVREMNMKVVPMERFGKPEEVSYMALFLATDMARYFTGAALAVDGDSLGGDQNIIPWGTPDPRNLKG